MKKIILLTSAAFIFPIMVNAQYNELAFINVMNDLKVKGSVINKEVRADRKELRKMRSNEVSSRSKDQFSIDFNNIKVLKWEKSPYFDEAIFVKDGKTMKAYYDIDSKLVGTISSKEYKDLPITAQDYINKNYQDYLKEDVLFFKDNQLDESDTELVNQQFDDQDNYFVALKKGNDKLVLQVNPEGSVYYFENFK